MSTIPPHTLRKLHCTVDRARSKFFENSIVKRFPSPNMYTLVRFGGTLFVYSDIFI